MAWWMKIVAQEKMDNEKLFADPCDVQCVAVCWGTSQTVVKARELRGCHWKCQATALVVILPWWLVDRSAASGGVRCFCGLLLGCSVLGARFGACSEGKVVDLIE